MPPSPVGKVARVSAPLISVLLTLAISIARAGPENHDPPPPNWLAGTLGAPRTLTVAAPGPQYVLYGDLTVAPGVTLTIEPGVEIVAMSNSDFLATSDPTRSEIIVKGTLMAIGTAGSPILFRDSESLTGSWGGLLVQNGAVARLQDARLDHAQNGVRLLQGTFDGIRTRIDATQTGLDVGVGAAACSLTYSFVGNATVGIVTSGAGVFAGDTIENVTNGISGNPAVVRECVVTSRPGGGGMGLGLSNANMTPLDTLGAITPVRVSGFGTGATLSGGTIRNALLYDNETGIQVFPGSTATINYCTIADNTQNFVLVFNASAWLMNSILAFGDLPNSIPTSYGYSVNWAPCGTLIGDAAAAFGPVACFDPEFADRPNDDYRLAPTSLFTDYSISGGHVGAFGPALSTLVGVEGVSVRRAGASGGRVAVTWGGLRPTEEVSVWRRASIPTWEPRGSIVSDGAGEATFEEDFPAPETATQYGIRVPGLGGEILAAVWVSPERRGTIELRAEPNPFSGPVRFRLTLSERALATIEIVDVMGRRVARLLPETALDPGTHVIDFNLRSPAGLYFVRARVGDRSVSRRIVFLD